MSLSDSEINKMTSKRVILTDADRFPIKDELMLQLSTHHIELSELKYGISEAELIEVCREVDGLIVYGTKITSPVIEQMTQCRIIARCGIGYDNIHVEAALNKGITVTYVPDFCMEEVSDHTVSLLLDCWRKTSYSSQRVREGYWDSYQSLGLMRRGNRQIIGFLGFGRIAQAVARKLQGFGLTMMAHDPYLNLEAAERYGIKPADQRTLLQESDVVILLMPLISSTKHILNKETMAWMKPGAMLVNTSRGGLVEEEALIQALQSGHLSAAALDVLETEPPRANHPLLQMKQVIITPHSAAYSEEALFEVQSRAVGEVIRNFQGLSPNMPVPVMRS